MKFQNQHVLNNYEFWNARGLRQYLLYVIDFGHKNSVKTVFSQIIVPYISSIMKMVKKFDILEELQGIIISKTFDDSREVNQNVFVNNSADIQMSSNNNRIQD